MNRPLERLEPDGLDSARFSTREFLHMHEVGAFVGMKVELDRGKIVRMNLPYLGHGVAQARLAWHLINALEQSRSIVVGEAGVTIGPDTVRACDLVVVHDVPADTKLIDPRYIRLAVEIADTTLDRDLGTKLHQYAEAGIALYWVIDVQARVVHVMSDPSDGVYRRRDIVRFGEPMAVPGTERTIML